MFVPMNVESVVLCGLLADMSRRNVTLIVSAFRQTVLRDDLIEFRFRVTKRTV